MMRKGDGIFGLLTNQLKGQPLTVTIDLKRSLVKIADSEMREKE